MSNLATWHPYRLQDISPRSQPPLLNERSAVSNKLELPKSVFNADAQITIHKDACGTGTGQIDIYMAVQKTTDMNLGYWITSILIPMDAQYYQHTFIIRRFYLQPYFILFNATGSTIWKWELKVTPIAYKVA